MSAQKTGCPEHRNRHVHTVHEGEAINNEVYFVALSRIGLPGNPRNSEHRATPHLGCAVSYAMVFWCGRSSGPAPRNALFWTCRRLCRSLVDASNTKLSTAQGSMAKLGQFCVSPDIIDNPVYTYTLAGMCCCPAALQ